MTKQKLTKITDKAVNETREALQTVYDSLNKGQRQKLLKNPEVVELFDRYGVETEGAT